MRPDTEKLIDELNKSAGAVFGPILVTLGRLCALLGDKQTATWTVDRTEKQLAGIAEQIRKLASDIELERGVVREICKIAVRGTEPYFARAVGLKISASSTCSREVAVDRVVDKVYEAKITPQGYYHDRRDFEAVRLDDDTWSLRFRNFPF